MGVAVHRVDQAWQIQTDAPENISGMDCGRKLALEQQQTFSICCFSADAQFRDRAIEEVDQSPRMAKEKEVCKIHFLQTHQQNESGRFIVSFSFQGHPDELGESRNHALR